MWPCKSSELKLPCAAAAGANCVDETPTSRCDPCDIETDQSEAMPAKHFRRRRRKKPREKICIEMDRFEQEEESALRMPRLVITIVHLSLMLLSILSCISQPTLSQVILDRPHRAHIAPPYSHHHRSVMARDSALGSGNTSSTLDKEKPGRHNPTLRSNNHHDHLLRKLSSTMLLENLLRHPNHPLKQVARLPFMLPHLPQLNDNLTQYDVKPQEISNQTVRRIKLHQGPSRVRRRNDTHLMEVSTTNIQNSISNETNADSFSPRSLSYLVDKLLSINPPKKDADEVRKPKRPAQRFTSEDGKNLVDHHELNNVNGSLTALVESTKEPKLTLDMLIRDEYNSRVRPMIKLLRDQQSLSTVSVATKRTPESTASNHRIHEDLDTANEATTTSLTTTNQQQPVTAPPDAMLTSTASPSRKPSIEADQVDDESSGASDDLEDPDHEEPEDEYEEDTKEFDDKDNGTSSSPVKKLNNVPPYQLGTSFVHRADLSTSIRPRASTDTRTAESSSKARGADGQGLNLDGGGERTLEATTRESLVFSDGGDEATIANNKRKSLLGIQKQQSGQRRELAAASSPDDSVPSSRNSSITQTKSDKLGDSFLLNQLFSTANPLVDLNHRLRGGHPVGGSPMDVSNANQMIRDQDPLIYKGYVGKDDYLLSTTAGDWSRPLNHNGRDASQPPPIATTAYRHPDFNSFTATPASTTDPPPTVPYSYYLHPHMTNAQSVPSMVIPGNDSSSVMDITTRIPMQMPNINTNKRMVSADNSKIFQRIAKPSRNQNEENFSRHNSPPSSYHSRNQSESFQNPRIIVHDKKYSYQIPDKIDSKSQVERAASATLENRPAKQKTNFTSMVGEGGDLQGKISTKVGGAQESSSWAPTKVSLNASVASESPMTNQRRKQLRPVDSSIPIVEGDGGELHSVLLTGDAESDNIDPATHDRDDQYVTNLRTKSNPANGSKFTNKSDDFSHGDAKSNLQRNKVKHRDAKVDQVSGSESGDPQGEERLKSDRASSISRTKLQPTTSFGRSSHKSNSTSGNNIFDGQQGLQDEDGGDNLELKSSLAKSNKPAGSHQNATKKSEPTMANKRRLQSGDGLTVQSSKQASSKKPSSGGTGVRKFFNHETAGSEISTTGSMQDEMPQMNLGSEFGKANQTTRYVELFNHSTKPTESILLSDGFGGSSFTSPAVQNLDGTATSPGLFGQAGNSNLFQTGDTSGADKSTLDQLAVLRNLQRQNQFVLGVASTRDPYQHTSSNNVLSSIQRPTSTTVETAQITPNMSNSNTTQVVAVVKQHNLEGADSTLQESATMKPPQPPITTIATTGSGSGSSKSSNDRLATILIGGSCVLSVVCLVLAAMSMRCQDMCDDYRSLRNAERAALKLQKHRLKYTKNHQISTRFGRGPSSAGSGQSLIEDNHTSNSLDGVLEPPSALSHTRNLRAQNNTKPMQIHDSNCEHHHRHNNNHVSWTTAAANLSTFKGNQSCECSNAHNRWLCNGTAGHQVAEQSTPGDKQLPWLYPSNYFMQQHNNPRLKPPFGVGSSVGTFFARQHDPGQSFRVGGSMDAQVLIDQSVPTIGGQNNSCLMAGATRSKSILCDGGKTRQLMSSECNNLEHHHVQHVCYHKAGNSRGNNSRCHHNGDSHQHYHHRTEASTTTATSENSDITFDGGNHCEHQCSGNPQTQTNNNNLGNKLRDIQLAKLNDQLSSNWKKMQQQQQQVGPSGSECHHLHNHHPGQHRHHHQHTASSDSSSPAPLTTQCTCPRDHQPLLPNRPTRGHVPHAGHGKHLSKHELRVKQQAKKDKLIWSTNRDRLI